MKSWVIGWIGLLLGGGVLFSAGAQSSGVQVAGAEAGCAPVAVQCAMPAPAVRPSAPKKPSVRHATRARSATTSAGKPARALKHRHAAGVR